MQDHRNLIVWHKAMALARSCLETTASFPPSQRYVLAAQMQRAAVSIPSNIAEGSARDSAREFARFLRIAKGSARELEAQAILARECRIGQRESVSAIVELAQEVERMLNALLRQVTS